MPPRLRDVPARCKALAAADVLALQHLVRRI